MNTTLKNRVSKQNPLLCMNRDCAGFNRAVGRLVVKSETRVKDSRFDNDTQSVKRVRRCDHCGREWDTVEVRR